MTSNGIVIWCVYCVKNEIVLPSVHSEFWFYERELMSENYLYVVR